MIQIQLDDHVADALTKQAESRGLSLSDYLALMATAQPHAVATALSAEELDRLLDEESTDDVTVEGNLSRAEIYNGHDRWLS